MFTKIEILNRANISKSTIAHTLLENTAENIAYEMNEQISHGEKNVSIASITENFLYEKYIMEQISVQLIIKLPQTNIPYKPATFSKTMDAILTKLALHMDKNNTDKIIDKDLETIFPSAKIPIRDYLDTCPLIVKDSDNNYQFQEGLTLKAYFVAKSIYEGLMSTQAQPIPPNLMKQSPSTNKHHTNPKMEGQKGETATHSIPSPNKPITKEYKTILEDTKSNSSTPESYESAFHAKHKSFRKLQWFQFARRTTIKGNEKLPEILSHAAEGNNRSRDVCIALGWLNKDGSLAKNAPAPIKEAYPKPVPANNIGLKLF